jgi:hypothetical protein
LTPVLETYMTYRNFKLLGEELLKEQAHRLPFRMNRLITALEEFVCGGPATRIAPFDPANTMVEVYLTPPRHILRGVPDAAALLLVDMQARTVEIIEVIDDYVETDEQDWLDLVARAERALESHR